MRKLFSFILAVVLIFIFGMICSADGFPNPVDEDGNTIIIYVEENLNLGTN